MTTIVLPSGRESVRETAMTCVHCAPASGPTPSKLYVSMDLRGGSTVLECARCGTEASVPTSSIPFKLTPAIDAAAPGRLVVLVEYEHDGEWWVASAPGIPGVRTQGHDIVEARERFWEALAAHDIERGSIELTEKVVNRG